MHAKLGSFTEASATFAVRCYFINGVLGTLSSFGSRDDTGRLGWVPAASQECKLSMIRFGFRQDGLRRKLVLTLSLVPCIA